MLKSVFSFLFIITSVFSMAQSESLLLSYSIPDNLRANANAVVRYDAVTIEINAYNKMLYTNKRIVTILNSSGDSKNGAYVGYNKGVSIKQLEAKIYNANGKEIKKIRKNDFEDVSAVPGGTLYSDNRVKYLNYTPIDYPYTILFETEVEYSSTAFIPTWRPIEGYYTSTENATYKIINNTDIEIKEKALNFEDFGVEKHGDFDYSVKNLNVIKYETYSPEFNKVAPYLKVALAEFEMEGVKGINTNWADFGKWMNDKLIQDTQTLPEQIKADIKLLTANANTDLEKAKIVYEYMQNKTRYISVQVGIGGWKPMLASDVDRLGYGDCKGLTNYTKALLDVIGVKNFYTVIYGGRNIRDIDESFSSTQGNHVILCVPTESDYLWLECTSQTSPFGYNANFTDDRDALIITPEGGKIVHTKVYKAEDNLLATKASVQLTDAGNFIANVTLKSYGTQYGYHYGIETEKEKDQILQYKEDWSYINALNINAMAFENNKDSIVFTEKIKVDAERYASKAGTRLLLQPNFFNRIESAPQRYSDRKLPFETERGFVDIDTYEINIPDNLEVEALMDAVNIDTKFGSYTASITQTENQKLLYKRRFMIKKGAYSKEEYEAFRAFWLDVVKYDKSKIVLKTKS